MECFAPHGARVCMLTMKLPIQNVASLLHCFVVHLGVKRSLGPCAQLTSCVLCKRLSQELQNRSLSHWSSSAQLTSCDKTNTMHCTVHCICLTPVHCICLYSAFVCTVQIQCTVQTNTMHYRPLPKVPRRLLSTTDSTLA